MYVWSRRIGRQEDKDDRQAAYRGSFSFIFFHCVSRSIDRCDRERKKKKEKDNNEKHKKKRKTHTTQQAINCKQKGVKNHHSNEKASKQIKTAAIILISFSSKRPKTHDAHAAVFHKTRRRRINCQPMGESHTHT